MRANPGGQIAVGDIIGRDILVRRLWDILSRQSLVLSAERRMGKTCVITKMVDSTPSEKLSFFRDLEGIRTPLEFAKSVFHDVEDYLSRRTKVSVKARELLSGFGITDFVHLPDTLKLDWKPFLSITIEDLVSLKDRPIILFWDELPLMIYNIKRHAGEDTAMEVLDVLRSLRSAHSDLRMVYTGSIGLHNIISALRKKGYANDPTNDMWTEDVPPLAAPAARELALRLLDGESLTFENNSAIAELIALQVDGIPFYIHHVVDMLTHNRDDVDAGRILQIINSSLLDPFDRWHFRYFLERIFVYYSLQEQPFALGILDILAISDSFMSFDDLFNNLKSRMVTEDKEMVLNVLELLIKDHYVILDDEGKYGFRFSLIKRWWKLHRGLIV